MELKVSKDSLRRKTCYVCANLSTNWVSWDGVPICKACQEEHFSVIQEIGEKLDKSYEEEKTSKTGFRIEDFSL